MSSNEAFGQDFPGDATTGGWLSNDHPLFGTLDPAGDADDYWFYMVAGTEYYLYLNDATYPSGTANDDIFFIVYASNDDLVAESVTDVSESGHTEYLFYTPTVSDFYAIHVLSFMSPGTLGSYFLYADLSDPSGDDHRGNEAEATALSLGAAATGTLEIEGDDDCFAFATVAGRRYVVEYGASSADLFIRVTNVVGDYAGSFANAPDGLPAVTADSSDFLYVHVESSTAVQTGNYELVVTQAASNTANFVAGGSGNDVLAGTAAQDEMHGGYGNDSISGLGNNDYLFGGAGIGNDTLDGGTGADTMAGGAGNDTYVLGAGDMVTELLNQGSDLVKSPVSYLLPANVEKLTLSGTGAINGTGNTLPNTLIGNTGANTLKGGDGADVLNGAGGIDLLFGGKGNDKLTGGAGADKFIFDTALNAASNKDTILDFATGDRIQLDSDLFTKLRGATVAGTTALAAAKFENGNGIADTPSEFILYNQASGALSYDRDGSGAAFAPVQFAVVGISVHPALTAGNFQIID